MESRKSFFKNPLIIACFGCVVAFAAACGDDDDSGETPTAGTKTTGGTSGTAGKTGNGGTTSAGKTNTEAGKTNTEGGTGNEAGTGATGNVGGEAGAGGAPDCTDATDHDCFKCVPKKDVEFRNQCPASGCTPFDNSKLTSLKNGVLPAVK